MTKKGLNVSMVNDDEYDAALRRSEEAHKTIIQHQLENRQAVRRAVRDLLDGYRHRAGVENLIDAIEVVGGIREAPFPLLGLFGGVAPVEDKDPFGSED